MSSPIEFRNYDEFFAYYLTQHSNPANRRMHAIGTCWDWR